MKHVAPNVGAKVQLAVDQLNAGNFAAAEATCQEIFALAPKELNALRVMGQIARERNQLDRCLDYCQQALRQAEGLAVLHFEIGVTYFALGRPREAYEAYLKAIELDPTLYAATLNVSAIMEQQERFAEARNWALKTLQIKPDYALAHYNLANAHRELGAIDEAIKSYELAHRYRPEHPKTMWNLGICHLLKGNFREGWPLFERRQDAEEVMFDRYMEPRWDGSPLDGRTIVVHAEQGIGDEILFASCFPDIIARARSGRCLLVCDPRLERLFARSFPQAKVYPHGRQSDWSPPVLPERIDVQIPAGSLPSFFRNSREAFPRRKRFLVVEPTLEAMWRERLAALGGEPKVGISWRAGGKPTERRKRSIPLEQWGEILATPGVQFVNLQYGDALADLAAAREKFRVKIHDFEEGDPLVDVDSYVAKISALDLVISVGNATVHMAGAVGTPAWTLLPTLPSWRWMSEGEVSPWYCGVRLFRQEQRGEWGPALRRIAGLLRHVAVSQADSAAIGLAVEPTTAAAKPQSAADDRKPREVGFTAALGRNGDETSDRGWLAGTELLGHEVLDTVSRLIAEGRVAEQLGDLTQAETCYREVLQLAPRQVKALCGLGIVARKTQRSELAIRCFRRALAVAEPVADHHLHLADALLDAGRVDEAVSGYQRALDLNPAHSGAQLQIGRVLRQAGRYEEAAEHLRNVIAFDPQSTEALIELGRCLAASCRIDEAIDCYRQALRLEPAATAALEAMGSAYLEDHCYEEAENCFRKVVASAPGQANGHFHLARALEAQSRIDEAAAAYERAIALDPKADGPPARLAHIRRMQGDLNAAAELFQNAIAAKPDDASLLSALGMVQRAQGALSEAIRSFDRALQLQPGNAEAHFNRGLALLQSGRLAAGWTEYEWRGRGGASAEQAPFSLPHWTGDSLAGRTILIHGEQSPADEVMFASCYEDVIATARDCVILCDPRLERLFKRSFPAAQVFSVVRGGEAQWRLPSGVRCDVQIAAGSLPRFLRSSAASFPRIHHFLTADAARVALWRKRYAATGEGLKIGLEWGGASDSVERSQFAKLVEWSGSLANRVQWINLQDGANMRNERAALESQWSVAIHDWPAAYGQYDLDDLAARVAALDLVISFGGLPGHLSGALGVPAWIVACRQDQWRWLAKADATPWYSSVRLFRAEASIEPTAANEPADPIERLREELLKRIESPAEELQMRSIAPPHWKLDAIERSNRGLGGVTHE